MNKLIITLVLVALAGTGIFVSLSGKAQTPQSPSSPGQSGSRSADQSSATYSLSDIAAHGTATDCWMAIHGKVYNVTEYVTSNSHPGGQIIAEGCGKDATNLFDNRPGDEGPHPKSAEALLPAFVIGTLSQ